MIYAISAILGEGIILGLLFGMGYDPLQGVMPRGQTGELLQYYGFGIFLLVTLLYCRLIEKKNKTAVGFCRQSAEYLPGVLLAAVLLIFITGIACLLDTITFCGVSKDPGAGSLTLWLLAFGIQGAAEETMCRGFLLNSLKNKLPVPMAIFISATAFVIPHLPGLLEAKPMYAVVGIINLYLISIIFSILALWRGNIWIVCGLHSGWNFMLHSIMGLSLSGSESVTGGVIRFAVKEAGIVNGAEYGIEAGVAATLVLGIAAVLLQTRWKGRSCQNGI